MENKTNDEVAAHKCEQCGKVCKSLPGLTRHINFKHVDKTDTKEAPLKAEAPAVAKKAAAPVVKEKPRTTPVNNTPVVVPPGVKAEVPAPPNVLIGDQLKGLTSIPLGAKISLTGKVWRQDPETEEFQELQVNHLEGTVRLKESAGSDAYLMLQVKSSAHIWCILESAVLDGTFRVISAPAPTEENGGSIPAPPVGKRVIPDDPEELARQELLPIFKQAITAYGDSSKAERAAINGHKEAKKEHYGLIKDFTARFGCEDENGNPTVKEEGYESCIVTVHGKEIVKRDLEKIIEYALQKGFIDCLNHSLDLSAWEKRKEGMDADGKPFVDVDFLREVEVPDKTADSFRLQVHPLADDEKIN